ncbi:MAG TPA: class I SAM-dependent methyltransferase [Vicinamibacterales bacterium]|nr:class I SAM-dependent methyltransferase [Vicinamibacterales bacterium]
MQDLDRQIDYWNRLGPAKPFAHPVNFERLTRWVAPEDHILDFGCGYGRVLSVLHSRGYRNVRGVDPAPAMIAAARQRLPTITVELLESPPHVDLSGGSVDAVLLFAVLTCIPTDDGQRAIIREIARVLRPGGLLYISDLWLQRDARNIDRYVRDESKYGRYGVFDLPEGVTVRHHDRRWIPVLTEGYEPVAVDEIEIRTMNGHLADGFQWFGLKRRN